MHAQRGKYESDRRLQDDRNRRRLRCPNAAKDLAAFSTQFGLPAANFQTVYASGKKPGYDAGWEFEESLDVQWSHAMAPGAQIVLVEAASSSFTDLMTAEDMASKWSMRPAAAR